MEELLAAEPWDLVILDEAHHARRKSPQQRKDTPNRLLQLMQHLRNRTKSLILLSATPMQIDPIEVFDLLDLLGLEGHWSYGDNFCNYFSSLLDEPDSHTLDFWRTMSTDYFRRGGEECDRLGEHLINGDPRSGSLRDRLMAYKLRDTWKQGKSIVNPKQLAQDTPFINASRQYLTVNTPLKDLMLRHTRDTLRQYYQLGILDRDIPRRIVSDNAIAQTCGVLIDYDLPWNPMRVEQRIGRIDRIGQVYSTVNIHNFYYDGTVEAKVYRKLRDRIDAFQSVVGNLQPILAQVPTFIEQAVMSADPEEEGVLLAEFEQVLDTPPLRPSLEEMVSQRVVEVPSVIATGEPVRVAMDIKADLKEIRKPLVSSPITSEQIEALFINSQMLVAQNIFFELKDDKPNGMASQRIWELTDKDKTYAVTFYPEVFDQKPSLRLINPGEPLFQKLLKILDKQNKLSFT